MLTIDDIHNSEGYKYLDKTTQKSKRAREILGGSDAQEEILRNIAFRETEEEVDKRKSLTNSISRSVLQPVFSYYDVVRRAADISIIIKGDDALKEKISGFFTPYFDQYNLLDFAYEMALWASKLDPNAWIVFERSTISTGAGSFNVSDLYPVIVSSSQVVDVVISLNGTLEQFIFETTRKNVKGEDVREIWSYAAGITTHYIEVKKAVPEFDDLDVSTYQEVSVGKDGKYLYMDYPNSCKEVPAIRLSAYLDDENDRETGETLYAAAEPLLLDIIRDKSFFDLQKVIHIRPEKVQYVKPCNYHNEESGLYCERGWLGGVHKDGNLCPQCRGTGQILSAGEQSVTTLAWPETSEELVDLGKLTHYFDRPIDIVNFYRSEIMLTSKQVVFTVFSQQAAGAEQLTTVQTATQATIEADKVNQHLQPFARLVEQIMELAWKTAFWYFDSDPESVSIMFPPIFKVKTLPELIEEYNTARSKNIPYSIIKPVEQDMLALAYKGDPYGLEVAKALEYWRPFKDKAAGEVGTIISNLANNDFRRLLWEWWDVVLYTVMEETERPFFILGREQQRSVLEGILMGLYESTEYIDYTSYFNQLAPPSA